MAYYPEPVARLIEALQQLPGIGPKTAQRLAFFMLKRPAHEVRELAESLVAVKERIVSCSTCKRPAGVSVSSARERAKVRSPSPTAKRVPVLAGCQLPA